MKGTKISFLPFFSLMSVMILTCLIMLSMIAKAAETPFSEQDVSKTYSCFVNEEKRTLTILNNGELYYNVGDETPIKLYPSALQAGMDSNGIIWVKDSYDELFEGCRLCWCNPEWSCQFWTVSRKNNDNDRVFVYDFSSLLYDESDFVTSYEENGLVYALPTVKELEEYIWPNGKPSPSPMPTVSPSTMPTSTPTVTVTTTPTGNITTTTMEATTTTPTTTTKTSSTISIVKKNSYYCLYDGEKLICKYSLKNKKLTYKRSGKKTLKYSGVKSAKYIYKSKNLVFITDKNSAYTISLQGKKKCICKKGAKKILCKDNWGVKIKKTNGNLNIRNK